MSKSHNKKRNAGLLYEFLVRSISEALVEGDKKRSQAGLRIVKRYFRPGTELRKEFMLVNSLVKTTVSSEATAASIIQEAKRAARTHNPGLLEKEKSLLIGAINKALNDPDFFDKQVNEYRTYATVQTLLNDWRSSDSDLSRVAQYEDQLLHRLTEAKPSDDDDDVSDTSPGEGRLLMKVMMRKLNEKYAGSLTDEQRGMLRAYAFATANDDPNSVRMKLQEVKARLLAEIEEMGDEIGADEYVSRKLTDVRQLIEGESLEVVDDDTVTRFMLYARLSTELTSEDK